MLNWIDYGPKSGSLQKKHAIALYNAVMAKQNGPAESYLKIGIWMLNLSMHNEACNAFIQAAKVDPNNAETYRLLGKALKFLGKEDEAMEAFKRAIEIRPDHADCYYHIAKLLEKDQKAEEALNLFKKAIDIEPEHIESKNAYARLELCKGNAKSALTLCNNSLRLKPCNTRALAIKIAALKELGNDDEAYFLENHSKFISIMPLTAPKEFNDSTSFNEALAKNIKADKTLANPRYKATRNGLQTSNTYDFHGNKPFEALMGMIRNAIESYILALPFDLKHPFIGEQPKSARINGWGVVLQKEGHQIPHIHPAGWLSGCYYISVSESVAKDKNNPAGWIEFGEIPPSFACKVESKTIRYKPEDGNLVLFPSYFPHRTIPVKNDNERICFAFDVIPVEE